MLPPGMYHDRYQLSIPQANAEKAIVFCQRSITNIMELNLTLQCISQDRIFLGKFSRGFAIRQLIVSNYKSQEKIA